jgi:TPR repeat protein
MQPIFDDKFDDNMAYLDYLERRDPDDLEDPWDDFKQFFSHIIAGDGFTRGSQAANILNKEIARASQETSVIAQRRIETIATKVLGSKHLVQMAVEKDLGHFQQAATALSEIAKETTVNNAEVDTVSLLASTDPRELHNNGNKLLQEGHFELAFACFKKASETKGGDPQAKKDALVSLGHLYSQGKGVKQSHEEASSHYQKAKDIRGLLGLIRLNSWADTDNGTLMQKEIDYCVKEAKARHVDVTDRLKQICDTDTKMKHWDYPTPYIAHATSTFEELVPKKYLAALTLGQIYENGWGVPQDTNQAIQWYGKAAEQENEVNIDRTERSGGSIVNEPECLKDLKRLAKTHWQANKRLVDYYQAQCDTPIKTLPRMLSNISAIPLLRGHRHLAEIRQEIEKAKTGHIDIKALERAAGYQAFLKGEADLLKPFNSEISQGLFEIAGKFETGDGVTKDLQRAARLYHHAILHGHKGAIEKLKELAQNKANIDANYLLGDVCCYEAKHPVGVSSGEKSLAQSELTQLAIAHMSVAADAGHGKAIYRLGKEYEVYPSGLDKEQWLMSAAEKGIVEAQHELGVMFAEKYRAETGGGRLTSAASKYFEKAVGFYNTAIRNGSFDSKEKLLELTESSYPSLGQQAKHVVEELNVTGLLTPSDAERAKYYTIHWKS